MNDRTKRLLLSAVSFVAIWNVCKFVMRNFIFHDYSFSPVYDIVIPLVVSAVVDAALSRNRNQ